jgi:putative flavoprotein involved in K+ transport
MTEGKRQASQTERVDTVVIGAGQAGLAASHCLHRRGLEHVVLERGRVGETWRSERWDGFYLNTPNWTLQLPGFPYRGPEPDAFASLREMITYLERYAQSFDAPVRENTPVERVRRDGARFLVETPAGRFSARNVIVAAGSYQRPTPTPLSRRLPPDVMSLHTSEYRRPGQLPEGAVAIVGSGQSGCQIAEELLAAGRQVYLFVSRCNWLPRRYRGRDVMFWIVETGLADQTSDMLPTPAARLGCNAPVSGNDGGHDCNARTLSGMGAILLGRLESVEGGVLRPARGVAESLAAGDEFVAVFRRMVDDLVAKRGMDVPDPEPAPGPIPVHEIDALDLRAAGVGAVIWANGFRPDHSWIEGVEIDAQGWPVQERGASSVPGLYFVGLHYLHKRKSALLLGVGEDAEHVAATLAKSISAND